MQNASPDHFPNSQSAYRAYLIGQTGKIEGSIIIDADNDEAAIQQIRDLARTHEVELWDRSRVIVRLRNEARP